MAKYFGLDIGSDSVKVLETEMSKDGLRLVHYASVSTKEQDLASVIKQAVKEADIKAMEVNIALPESDVYTRIVQTPKLSRTELASAIQYEAEQYVPVSLDEVELYHQVLTKVEDSVDQKTMDVLLIAVAKEKVKRLTDMLDLAGLIPRSLETELLTLRRVFADVKKAQMLIQLGQKSTDLIVLDKGIPALIHSTATGGLALTKTLANGLGLPEDEAEEYKRTYGLREDLLEGKVAKLLLPLIGTVIGEIKKANVFIQQSKKHSLPEELIVSGGGALLPGLSSYLAEQLNIEVIVGDPFSRFLKDEAFKKMIAAESSPQLATVTGLAIKESV